MKAFLGLAATWMAMSLAVAAQTTAGGAQTTAAPAQDDPAYQVGVGDVIHIAILNHHDQGYDEDYEVQADGAIVFKDIANGQLNVSNLTVRQIESKLANQLKTDQVIGDAQVSVTIVKYRSKTVNVQGEVRGPGQIVLMGNAMTVLQAINQAGGTLPSAGAEVLVRHTDAAGKTTQKSIPRGQLEAGQIEDVPLQDGDFIYVPPAPKFFVQGYVNSPNMQFWVPGLTVEKAIQGAGGFKQGGSKDPHLHYVDKNGKVQDVKVNNKDIATYVIPREIAETGTLFIDVPKSIW
jgi:polysaccharide export outer membrane protein